MASTPRISRGTRRTLAWHPPSGLLWVPGEETGRQHPQTTSCWQQAPPWTFRGTHHPSKICVLV